VRRVRTRGGSPAVNNTRISHAVQLGGERIYVLRPTSRTLACVRGVRQGALAAASRAFTVLVRACMNPELAHDAISAELLVLPADGSFPGGDEPRLVGVDDGLHPVPEAELGEQM
jgi:hypothetical protein